MNVMQKTKHQGLSPWQHWLNELDASEIKVKTSEGGKREGREVTASPSGSKSKSKPKNRVCRTSIKISKINLQSNQNIRTSREKNERIESLTPKGLRTGRFFKSNDRWSPDLRKGGSIMSIDTWREESKRLLASMANKKCCIPRQKSRTTLQNRQPQVPASTVKNSPLIYKKARAEYPNLTRFRLIQWQKNSKP